MTSSAVAQEARVLRKADSTHPLTGYLALSSSRGLSGAAALSIAALIGLAGVSISALGAPLAQFAKALGTGIVVEIAAAAAGALVGFLFGIPRAVASTEATEPSDGDRRRYAANTNLEQISDWLTKILVGVGLVQIGSLSDAGRGLATSVATDMASSLAVASALLIYAAVCGLLGGYVVTRTLLTQAFLHYDSLTERVEVAEQRAAAAEAASARVAADVKALSSVESILAGGAESPELSDLVAQFKAASPAVLAQIFYRASALRSRNWRTAKQVMARTIAVFRALCVADDRGVYHRNFGELGFALKDQDPPDWVSAETAFSEAIEIRNRSKISGFRLYEFGRAQCRIASDEAVAGPTSSQLSENIVADLREALARSITVKGSRLIENDAQIMAWLQRNGLSVGDLSSTSPNI